MTTEKKSKTSPESIVREIKRKTRRKFTAEEKIRIVLEGLRGEESITDLCRKEGIHPTMYYNLTMAQLISQRNSEDISKPMRSTTSGPSLTTQ